MGCASKSIKPTPPVLAPAEAMKRCLVLPPYPESNEADEAAAYLGSVISLYAECAIRHDGLVDHVEKTNKQ